MAERRPDVAWSPYQAAGRSRAARWKGATMSPAAPAASHDGCAIVMLRSPCATKWSARAVDCRGSRPGK